MKGLFFYKLSSPFKEDITKECKLNICEVDNNFMALKEASIANIEIDENNKLKLIPYGANEKPIEVDLSQLVASSTLDDLIIEYDSKKGIITFKNQDKILFEVDKLLTSDNTNFNNAFLVTHDNTLIGNGDEISPLRVSPIEETNSYGMVIKLIDTINKNETLPENPSVGDRYVVYETNNSFGYLYNYESVKKILTDIKDSGWRIPTVHEWNKMLNAIDCLPNHSDDINLYNIYFGKDGGQLLKSKISWDYPKPQVVDGLEVSPKSITGIDKYNMSVFACGKGTFEQQIYGIGKTCEFWTNDFNENTNEAFTKEFNYNKGGVGQFKRSMNNYYSLRLVKDYNGSNYTPVTMINGNIYQTVLIDSFNSGPLIWLAENVKFSDEKYLPLAIEDSEGIMATYNIVEWDGISWLRKKLNDGDIILIEKAPNNRMRIEYRLNGNTLEEIKQVNINNNDSILSIDDNKIITSSLDLLQINPLCYTLIGKNNEQFTSININIPNTINHVSLVLPATENDKIIDDTIIIGKNYIKFDFADNNYDELNTKPIYILIDDIIESYKYKESNSIEISNDNTIQVRLNKNISNMLEIDNNGLSLTKLDFLYIED